MTEILARQIPLLNPSENEHMPLLPELGGPFGTWGYTHGAPNGAFCMAATNPAVRKMRVRCSALCRFHFCAIANHRALLDEPEEAC